MGSNRHYFKRGISYLSRNGIRATVIKGLERIERNRQESGYKPSVCDEKEILRQRAVRFEVPYKISILVPVYETDPELLRKTLDSVGEQTYGNWELILADASRDDMRRNTVRDFMEDYSLMCKDEFGSVFEKVKYVRLTENKGISGNTNEALSHAKGDYVGLLDHDDLLEPDALFEIMSAIENDEKKNRDSDKLSRVMAVYTDEDKISEDGRHLFDPNFKPDFDPVMLLTNNYICHFFVADANLAKSVGGFRPDYDGAQDHDFILRCTEGVGRDRILHVAKVLYHWRSTAGSTSENPDAKLYAYEAGKRAVQDHLKRCGIEAQMTDSPHLGFFVPEYAKLHRSVSNITTEENTEFVMILSNELRPLDATYIEDMMSCMHFPYIGAVTGKIIGKDGRIESAGFSVSSDGARTPEYAHLNRHFSGYLHRASIDRLTDDFAADCVLVRREAVKEWSPKIRLFDRYDVYYNPRAVFKRI